MNGIADEPSVRVQQSVIDAPCIDAYRAQLAARSGTDGIFALRIQPEDIPCKAPRDHLRFVGKSVYLAQRKLFAVVAADNAAPA